MGDHKLSVSWDSHQNNICQGLSALQQRGEFVDMTLAADGHHVKVHQMVMSLVSPYIKELIASAQCPHPVVFLNKVSYKILQAILEYVYSGEVLLPRESLTDFLHACRELHIKGLEGDAIAASENNDLLHVLGARQGENIDKARERRKEENARKIEERERSIIEAARKASNNVSVPAGDRSWNMEVIVESQEDADYENEPHNDSYQMDEHALDDVEEPKIDNNDTQKQTDQDCTINTVIHAQGTTSVLYRIYLSSMLYLKLPDPVLAVQPGQHPAHPKPLHLLHAPHSQEQRAHVALHQLQPHRVRRNLRHQERHGHIQRSRAQPPLPRQADPEAAAQQQHLHRLHSHPAAAGQGARRRLPRQLRGDQVGGG